MSGLKKWFLVLVAVASAASVWGQAAPSPFTTGGIGEPYGNALIHNQGNGLGVSQPQYWYINNQNPALLVFNNLSVFQVGVVGESRKIKGDTLSEKSTGGNLNYLVMAFPIKQNKWTTSVGLMPYTNVDFSFQYLDYARDPLGAIQDTLVTTETGSGGLTQVYWANGVRVNKDMSVGLRINYLFGPVSNVFSNAKLPTASQPTTYVANVEDKLNIHGVNFGLGYSFSKDSLGRKKNRRLSFGAVYYLPADLTAKRTSRIYRTTLANDTLEIHPIAQTTSKVNLPQSFTVGVSYGRATNWSIGTEFFYQDWSKFKSPVSEGERMGKGWRASVGGEYTADPFALENYLKRITFRVGGSYEQYPFYAGTAQLATQLKDYGINFGFSLPAGRSSIDLAAKIGKRGNKDENVFEETYFKIYFGITFNDQWFIKRKFD